MSDEINKISSAVQAAIKDEEKSKEIKKKPELSSKFIEDCYWANELGDGILFNSLHRGKFVYNKMMGTWMVWKGHSWGLDVFDEARAAVENVCAEYQKQIDYINEKLKPLLGDEAQKDLVRALKTKRSGYINRISGLRSMRRRENCLRAAHTCDDPLAVKGDEIDRKPWLLACANGVIDLKTGKLSPGRPEDYLFKACPVEYRGIDEPRPVWKKTLLEICEEDELSVAYLQRLFGMAIVGAVFEHILPVFTGPGGRNGKSTIIETISRVLGPLSAPIRSEMLIDTYQVQASAGPTPDIMALRGLRIAWASETKDGAKISSAKVKWLTGGDQLSGRNPHDKFEISFPPSHTIFLLSNFKPHADTKDKAFWERVQNLPFTISFLKNREPTKPNERRADIFLAEKLDAELSGILGWMVEGCLQWQLMGLKPPPRVLKETQDYMDEEDNLSAFIEYCLELDEMYSIGATDLYNAFERWWKKYVTNFPPKQKKFGKEMREYFTCEKTGGVYRYYGCRLNDEWSRIMTV